MTFTVQIPTDQVTRAGEGDAVDQLYYAIYDQVGEGDAATPGDLRISRSIPMRGGTATIHEKLVPGKTYTAAFWAANQASPYTFDASTKTMTVNTSALTASSENGDGFFGSLKGISTAGKGYTKTVTLTRPFAQINLGTDDMATVNDQGISLEGLTCTMTVSGLYTAMNIFTGNVTGEAQTLTFTGAVPTGQTYPKSGYQYLGYAYVLLPVKDDQETLTVGFATNNNMLASDEWSNVPAKRNMRTNIYGSLLTNPADITVVVDPLFNGVYDKEVDGAVVTTDADNKVVCITPALPEGVTVADLQEHSTVDGNPLGGVVIGSDGQPQYFANTGKALSNAMKQSTEVYLAPNVTINTQSHFAVVPATGVTVHGNGASFSGGEMDFSIQDTKDRVFAEGSTVNINISNFNNVKVWGNTQVACTFNINLTNCTMEGSGLTDTGLSLIMTRGSNESTIININLDNCFCENVQVGIHSTSNGTVDVSNTTFKNVGVPINLAKKPNGGVATANIDNCTFEACGLNPDGDNSAKDYAAPIRIVDNGGPADSMIVDIANCRFVDCVGPYDILLMDYRSGKTWYPVKYTITNSGNPTVRDK